MITLIALLVFVTTVFIAVALFRPTPNDLVTRLEAYSPHVDRRELNELDRPFSERVLWPIVVKVAKLLTRASPQTIRDKVMLEIEQAGNPINPATFLTLRGVLLILAPAFYGLPLLLSGQPVSLLQLGVLAVLFYFGARLPVMWLRMKIRARQGKIEKALPDALDLITVCVEAGLAFDGALAKVVQKTVGPLSDELSRMLQEVNLGKARRDAMRDLGTRAGVADLRSFAAAIIQADQMGIPIGNILRTQSDELRLRRRQRAEEKAMKAPVKMLFPLILCIFPAMMIVMLGPAVYAIYVNIIQRMQGL